MRLCAFGRVEKRFFFGQWFQLNPTWFQLKTGLLHQGLGHTQDSASSLLNLLLTQPLMVHDTI
jgi:hypothetical protein